MMPIFLAIKPKFIKFWLIIINNAVDAMDGEGTINIHITNYCHDDPFLQTISRTF